MKGAFLKFVSFCEGRARGNSVSINHEGIGKTQAELVNSGKAWKADLSFESLSGLEGHGRGI